MDARSLAILEYDKIIHELTLLTHSSPGRELCEALQPVSILSQAVDRQTETDDAVKLILEKGVLPLSGISDNPQFSSPCPQRCSAQLQRTDANWGFSAGNGAFKSTAAARCRSEQDHLSAADSVAAGARTGDPARRGNCRRGRAARPGKRSAGFDPSPDPGYPERSEGESGANCAQPCQGLCRTNL